MEHLKPDGYHIRPEFDSLLDKTYACALLGCFVPEPTPFDNFAPDFARRRFMSEFPRLVRGQEEGQRPASSHGWLW